MGLNPAGTSIYSEQDNGETTVTSLALRESDIDAPTLYIRLSTSSASTVV